MRRIVKYTAVTLAMAGVALFIVFFGLQLRKGPQGPATIPPYKRQTASLTEHWMHDTLYIGEWVDDRPYSCGTMVMQNKSVTSGFWKYGKKNGLFRTTSNDGTTSISRWEADTLVEVIDSIARKGIYGVDLSKHQNAHWSSMLIREVNEQDTLYIPIQFVIIKASEGKSYKDPLYHYHSTMATLTNIPQGAYHLFWPSEDAEKQVKNFLEAIEGRTINGPIVLDIEGSTLEVSAKKFKKMKPKIQLWLKGVEQALGRKPMIYCCNDFYKHYGSSEIFDGYEFWVAKYSNRDIPSDWAIHQYSERGKVEGWPMNVDLDYKERTYTEITNHIDTLKL